MSAELERRLEALGRDLEWPPTPDLAGAVAAQLREGGPRRRARRPRLALALALVLALVPAGGALAFGDEVLEWLGLASVEVRRAPALPADARRPALAELGTRVSLAGAEARAGFRPLLPRPLGPPEEVRERDGVVTLVYDGGAVLLAQLRGRLDRALVGKTVTPGTEVRRVPGGFFVSGPEHAYLYRRPSGGVGEDRPFLAGPTLVVERRGVLLRLEAPRLTPARGLALLGR